MSMAISKDMLKVIRNPVFREQLQSVLIEVTGNLESYFVVNEMLESYYKSTKNPVDKTLVLPLGYHLNIKKFGGIFLEHNFRDCYSWNFRLRSSIPNFYLFFNRRRKQ
jgi:hypothetical protein